MKSDIKVDLHTHTTASDGTWSAQELTAEIVKTGISLFAITDHDSVGNVKEGEKLAKENGLSFIRGVEVSSLHNKKTYHILGLGINPDNPELVSLLNENERRVNKQDDEDIAYLETKYSQVSYEEYLKYENDRRRGGWKSLNYLKDKGLCTNYKEFMKLFSELGDSFGPIPFLPPEKVIDTIIGAGGIPVLAHPGSGMYGQDYENTVTIMLELGIQGFECYHPENSTDVTSYCLKVCKDNKLRITGGSDCHGPFVSTRRLGYPDVSLSMLNLEGIEII